MHPRRERIRWVAIELVHPPGPTAGTAHRRDDTGFIHHECVVVRRPLTGPNGIGMISFGSMIPCHFYKVSPLVPMVQDGLVPTRTITQG